MHRSRSIRGSWVGRDICQRRSSYTSSATRSPSWLRRTAGLRSSDGLSDQRWSTRTEWKLFYSRVQEGLVDRCRPPALAALDLGHRRFMRHGGPIRARGRERIIYVYDTHDLRGDGDLLTTQAIGVARAVLALAV